jgi:hypothetical protein
LFIGILFAIYFAYKKIFSYRDTQKELVRMRGELGSGMVEVAKFEDLNRKAIEGKEELPSDLLIEDGEDKS